MCWPGLFLTIMGPNIVSDWYMDMMYDSPLWYDMSALKISVLLSTLITLTVCHMILRWVWGIYHSVSLYICVHVHIHGCVSSRIVSTPWRIKWFLLQIVAFIEIYEHARLDTHTHAHTHCDSRRDGWAWKAAWEWKDERQKRLEERPTCELLRYKQVNDFLFFLRLFPHLSAWPSPWRDGLKLQSLTKQPW